MRPHNIEQQYVAEVTAFTANAGVLKKVKSLELRLAHISDAQKQYNKTYVLITI